jgi:hypothetical protein
VGDVGEEVALAAGGGGDAAGHRVETGDQAAQLVRAFARDVLFEVALCHGVGCPGEAIDGGGDAAAEEVAGERGDRQGDGGGDHEDRQVPAEKWVAAGWSDDGEGASLGAGTAGGEEDELAGERIAVLWFDPSVLDAASRGGLSEQCAHWVDVVAQDLAGETGGFVAVVEDLGAAAEDDQPDLFFGGEGVDRLDSGRVCRLSGEEVGGDGEGAGVLLDAVLLDGAFVAAQIDAAEEEDEGEGEQDDEAVGGDEASAQAEEERRAA